VKFNRLIGCGLALALACAGLFAGCGDVARSSRSPSQLVILNLSTARGTGTATPTQFFGGPLASDVPNFAAGETVFDDFGQAVLRVIMRDQGPDTAPSPLNDVTVTQYRVVYRGTAGVDVPRPINGAMTLTVPVGGTATGTFEIVRHVAKLEPPLTNVSLGTAVLSTIADVTFFGRDQAGNEVSVTGTVPINFANFN
jgi:hypothetical protein